MRSVTFAKTSLVWMMGISLPLIACKQTEQPAPALQTASANLNSQAVPYTDPNVKLKLDQLTVDIDLVKRQLTQTKNQLIVASQEAQETKLLLAQIKASLDNRQAEAKNLVIPTAQPVSVAVTPEEASGAPSSPIAGAPRTSVPETTQASIDRASVAGTTTPSEKPAALKLATRVKRQRRAQPTTPSPEPQEEQPSIDPKDLPSDPKELAKREAKSLEERSRAVLEQRLLAASADIADPAQAAAAAAAAAKWRDEASQAAGALNKYYDQTLQRQDKPSQVVQE